MIKDIFIGIIIGVIVLAVVSPYYSLLNLSDLSKLRDVSAAIKDCTKEIHELVKSVDRLREEVKKGEESKRMVERK